MIEALGVYFAEKCLFDFFLEILQINMQLSLQGKSRSAFMFPLSPGCNQCYLSRRDSPLLSDWGLIFQVRQQRIHQLIII